MKTVILFLLLGISTGSVGLANGPSRYRTTIVQNNQILAIKIDGYRDGRKLFYDRTFDVSDKNYVEKKWLKYRVFRSLDMPLPADDIRDLVLAAFGLTTVVITALIFGYRALRSR
ncbi:hypothetical protein GCM10027299_54180 [Larkinella ripae]